MASEAYVTIRLHVEPGVEDVALEALRRYPPRRIGRRNGDVVHVRVEDVDVWLWLYRTQKGALVVEQAEPAVAQGEGGLDG